VSSPGTRSLEPVQSFSTTARSTTSMDLAGYRSSRSLLDTQYFFHDSLGSTRALLSSSAVWRRPSPSRHPACSPARAAPLRRHSSTRALTLMRRALLLLVHRYYDPQTGQFLNVDPLVTRRAAVCVYGRRPGECDRSAGHDHVWRLAELGTGCGTATAIQHALSGVARAHGRTTSAVSSKE